MALFFNRLIIFDPPFVGGRQTCCETTPGRKDVMSILNLQ
jgi:hypothetical protein